jgi:hypothetical protein
MAAHTPLTTYLEEPMSKAIREHSHVAWAAIATALVASLAFSACEDDDDLGIITPPGDTVLVAAFRDTTVNFNAMLTFAMPDTVLQFAPATGTALPISRGFDATILDRVHMNLRALGFQEAIDPQNNPPHFVVLVRTTATENQIAFVNYAWFTSWGFYNGLDGFDPGFDATWGIVYPWAPVAGLATFDRGTIVVDLIPTLIPSQHIATKTVSGAWTGVATGLLDGTTSTTEVQNAIDRMFTVSPYLRGPRPVQQ